MSSWFQNKFVKAIFPVFMVATLLVSAIPAQTAAAQGMSAIIPVYLNKGWTKFSWVSSVRGNAFSFAPNVSDSAITTSDIVKQHVVVSTVVNGVRQNVDTAVVVGQQVNNTPQPDMALPSQLTFVATANVTCPSVGNVVIPIRVYDFGQLVNSTSATIDCSQKFAYTDPTISHTPDEYAANPHYLHATVSVPSGGAHDLVIEADLPTTDILYWGYVRVDSAPNTTNFIDYSSNEAVIAATVVNPPANAWIGVQWVDPTGTIWTMVDTWLGPLDQAALGRTTRAVDPKDFGTGPYRWVVYTGDPAQGGQLWGVSQTFYFPRTAHDWLWTQIYQTVH